MDADEALLTGPQPLAGDGVVAAGNSFASEPAAMQFSDGTSGDHARRPTTEFRVDMSDLDHVPRAEAADLTAQTDIRRQRCGACQALHAIMAARNFDGFVAMAQPWPSRPALMNGYPDVPSVARRVSELNPMAGHPGSRMLPLMSKACFQAVPLRRGSTGQPLASMLDPIQYVDAASGERTGGMRLFLVRRRGEPLRIHCSRDSGQQGRCRLPPIGRSGRARGPAWFRVFAVSGLFR